MSSETLPSTKEVELTAELARLRRMYDALVAEYENLRQSENARIVEQIELNNRYNELLKRGPAPSHKVYLLAGFTASMCDVFLRWPSAKTRWDRAEALYAEGVRRGYLPADE